MSMITAASLNLSSNERLEGVEKQRCPTCTRMRKFFCYDCRTPMEGVFTPQVELPCFVDIVKHPMEKNSKSSALHCKIVAPAQTRVFDYPDVYDYRQEEQGPENGGSTVLVFPSPCAVSIQDFVRTRGPIKRFVVLDCTWFQVGVMQRIPQIQGLPCVSLRDYKTAFWRPQHKINDSHLATIEAIYYALREYQEYGMKQAYQGSFDDLLFWFFFTREKFDARREDYAKRQQQAREKLEQEGADSQREQAGEEVEGADS